MNASKRKPLPHGRGSGSSFRTSATFGGDFTLLVLMFVSRDWRVAGKNAGRVVLLFLLSLPAAYTQPAASPFTDELWNDVRPIYKEVPPAPLLAGSF